MIRILGSMFGCTDTYWTLGLMTHGRKSENQVIFKHSSNLLAALPVHSQVGNTVH